MKVIPVRLTNAQTFTKALVDDEDYEILKTRKWSLVNGYARTGFTNRILFPSKRQVYVTMHRAVLWCPPNLEIDHIDGNRLNNQKSNLRQCSRTGNVRNSQKRKDNTSGYKGVTYDKNTKKWRAQISVNKVMKHIGSFDDKKSAAIAYNASAEENFGEFAHLNKV